MDNKQCGLHSETEGKCNQPATVCIPFGGERYAYLCNKHAAALTIFLQEELARRGLDLSEIRNKREG